MQRFRLRRHSLLIFTDVPLEVIASQGKAFNWIRPSCSCGAKKVWGHGYVARFFSVLTTSVFLKRYLCPSCGRVFTMMPAGYLRRYQSPGAEIARTLKSRLDHNGWPAGIPRQRAGHWLRKFLALCRFEHSEEDPPAVLDRLLANGLHFLS